MLLLEVLLALLLLHLELLLLLLSVLGNARLHNVQMAHDVVFGGRQLVGVLETRLGLQQAATLHVHDA